MSSSSDEMSPSPSMTPTNIASLFDVDSALSASSTTQKSQQGVTLKSDVAQPSAADAAADDDVADVAEMPMPLIDAPKSTAPLPPVAVMHPQDGVTVAREASVQTMHFEETHAPGTPLLLTDTTFGVTKAPPTPPPPKTSTTGTNTSKSDATSPQKSPGLVSAIKNVVQRATHYVEKKQGNHKNNGTTTTSTSDKQVATLSPETLQQLAQQPHRRVIIHHVSAKDPAELIDVDGNRHKLEALHIPTAKEKEELPATEGATRRIVTQYVYAASEPRLVVPQDVQFAASGTASPIANIFNKESKRMETRMGMTESEPLSATSISGVATSSTQQRIHTMKPAHAPSISPEELEQEILTLKHHNSKMQQQISNYGRKPNTSKLTNLNRRVERALKHVDRSKVGMSVAYRQCVENLFHLCDDAQRVDQNMHHRNVFLEGASTEKTPLIEGKSDHASERVKQLDQLAQHTETLRQILTEPTLLHVGDRPLSISEVASHMHYQPQIMRKDLAKKRKVIREKLGFVFLVGGVLLTAMAIFLVLLTIVLVKAAQAG